jgi:uncharacterized phage protein (TIGR02218 family)
MKTLSTALANLFNANVNFSKADLYTWTFNDGSVLRATDADVALTVGGNTFASCKPAMERTKVTLTNDLKADSIDVTITPATTDTIFGLSWQAAAVKGYLDGATLLVETAYIQTWPTVIDKLYVFSGKVSDVVPARTSVKLTVKSPLELLVQQFPRNVYQSVCLHAVYDTGCGVNRASYTVNDSVTASPTTTSFKTGNAQAAGYFDQGVIAFSSGVNNGLRRTIKSYDPATGFTFALPLPVAPTVGDTVSAYPGCDKTMATCGSKFNNLTKFRGCPFVPNPNTPAPVVKGYTRQGGKG